jgi:predicted DNA-binding transcriptional regulator YafY
MVVLQPWTLAPSTGQRHLRLHRIGYAKNRRDAASGEFSLDAEYGRRDCSEHVRKALMHRYAVRLEYTAAGQEKAISRDLDPYKLWYVNNACT